MTNENQFIVIKEKGEQIKKDSKSRGKKVIRKVVIKQWVTNTKIILYYLMFRKYNKDVFFNF